jgi:4-hydroxy-tetrahydrodipicolinate synthase
MLAGVSAVAVTPFHDDGSLDEEGVQRVAARLAAACAVVVANGNTGEWSALTHDEAATVARLTIDACGPRPLVLVGVGGDLAGAVDAAAAAISAGARGVLVHAVRDPYVSDDGLIRYYEALAAATDGVVVPYLRDRPVSDRVLEHVLACDNVVAVKYAIADVQALARLVRRFPETPFACGLAELWAPFFTLAGARGFTSGLVNLTAGPSGRLLAALEQGDAATAMGEWERIAPFERLRARHANGNNVPAVKAAMALRGLCGATVRPPLAALDEADHAELRRVLADLGDEP